MLSTKSRLDTSPPGAKNRTSSRFSGVTFGTAGQTSGRSSRLTIVSTGRFQLAVNGSRSSSAGGRSASSSSRRKAGERHAGLVGRDRQPALGHVEDALGGAAVVDRVVQHAVVEAVAGDQLVLVAVAVEREAQLAGEAVLVEDEGLGGEADGAGRALELVEVVLDPAVGGAEVVGQEPGLLAVAGEEVAGEVEDVLVAGGLRPGSRRPWRRA